MASYHDDKLIAAVKAVVPRSNYVNVNYGGCGSGAVGRLIYYRDTVAFHDEHEEAIWDLVNEEMESYGETDNIVGFIACLNGAENVGSMDQFKNLLTWFAVETLVRRFTDELENDGISLDNCTEENDDLSLEDLKASLNSEEE